MGSCSSTTSRYYLVLIKLFLLLVTHVCSGEYYGKLIGKLSELNHGVSGEVYAVDARTLFIKDFTYDGEGPTAYFYAGNSKNPITNGFRIRDERGMSGPLRRYRKKGITLTLPEGKTLNNIKWFAVWCDEFSVNFGDVRIPRGFDYPKPQKLQALNGVHAVSSEPVVIVDAQTLLIPGFSYDGEAPDAKFWVGSGPHPSPQGILVPDENGKIVPLRRYDRKTIVLTLPGDLTVLQLGHFGVWCEAFAVDFGHIQIPQNLNIPPSLKMLGVSPQTIRQGQGDPELEAFFAQSSPTAISTSTSSLSTNSASSSVAKQNQRPTTYRPLLRRDDNVQVVQAIDYRVPKTILDVPFSSLNRDDTQKSPQSYARLIRIEGDQRVDSFSKLNCEVLEDNLAFEVRWAVAGDSIVVQLVGKLNTGQYMSFGLSANPERSQMVGGDVVVAWVDKQTLQGYAVDYFLDAKSQCSGGRGSCPDSRIQENTNSVRLLNAAMVNGYSIVTYQRPLGASDELDRQIRTNGTQAIIWAIGPLNERNEVSFHSHWLKTDKFIEFGRPPSWNCPMPDTEEMDNSHDNTHDRITNNQELMPTTRRPSRPPATPAPAPTNGAWEIPPIECNDPEDGVFYAQMGPTGGKHGYPAITGHVGWGISWYINGLLIPEINVVRGRTYTFVVEGGDDPDKPALYHPFYITDDPIGGYAHKTPEEKARVKIFAGVQRQRGTVVPTGTGRWCSWLHDQNEPEADEYTSFGAFQRTLSLKCNPGEPGIVTWTPDKNTPDTVYYQCFTHRYLGWKINVHDNCDIQGQASENHEFYIKPDLNEQIDDLDSASSINLSSKVTTPVPDFYKPAKQDYGMLRPTSSHHHYHNNYNNHHHNSIIPQKLINMHQPLTRASILSRDNYERYKLSQTELLPPRPSYIVIKNHNINNNNNNNNNNNPKELHHKVLQSMHHSSDHDTSSSLVTPHYVSGNYRDIKNSNGWKQLNLQDQDKHQSQLSILHSPNLQSNSITDKRQFNYINMKYHQQNHKPSSLIYQANAINKPTQMMIIRRPIRRPQHQLMNQELPHFIERKKSIYREPMKIPQLTKIPKIDKQVMKIESKMTIDNDDIGVKPARNTGFDPDSIVIEGGFKPIIRGIERDDDSSRNQDYSMFNWNDKKIDKDETFEPIYHGSVRHDGRKRGNRVQSDRVGQRLDDVDDMEMAADGLDAYYLPPPTEQNGLNTAATTKRLDDRLTGTLIAFDGKRVKDSSLARSIPGRNSDQSSSGRYQSSKFSDVLKKTPQFGKFTGELPPPIPGDDRTIDFKRDETDGNTKLTVQRSKRASDTDNYENKNHTLNAQENHHHDNHHYEENEQLTLASTGQMIITNIEYIFLTIILYYAM